MKRRIALITALIILAFLLFAAWEIAGPATAFEGERYYALVRTNMSFDELYKDLLRDRTFKHPRIFHWVAERIHYPEKMKAGRYEIKSGESFLAIFRKLVNGRQTPVNLVITKLRTKEDLSALVGRKLECDSASFFRFLGNNDSLREFSLDTNTVMTAVFPNTYNYFWNTGPRKVFLKLFAEYRNFWNKERVALVRAQGLNPQSAYIIASIVEEETARKEDKGKVASVYINRLKKNMKLDADPTIKFALRDFELRRIYEKYLQVESPYNTYKYAGLPPGPICTPSMETLEAVIHAPSTRYLYFVAKPDFSGYSNFAEDYAEHRRNAKAYQKALDQQMKIATDAKKGEIR